MVDVALTGRQQSALRQLLALDAVPSEPIPRPHVFELVDRLVPADQMGAGVFDHHGFPVAMIELPRAQDVNPVSDDHGPMYLGFIHWPAHPVQAEACGTLPGVDGVTIGFRNGPDHVSQVWFDRRRVLFSEQELALLRVLVPVFKRLLRERPTTRLPATLTAQERNVLMEIAAGSSNAEVAANLSIAPATVRKHLEHAYRKLDVTNRLAAVMVFTGRTEVGQIPEADRITGWSSRSTRERV